MIFATAQSHAPLNAQLHIAFEKERACQINTPPQVHESAAVCRAKIDSFLDRLG
jgi:hypothetical protein